MNSLPYDPEDPPELPEKAGIRILRTGFLVAGSVLLGGLAVVFWNRKSLVKLRQPSPAPVLEDAEEE